MQVKITGGKNPKLKPCKGHGKAKGFEGCGDDVPMQQRTYGLCWKCRNKWAATTEEGQVWLQKKVIPKAKKEVKKKQRKKDKETRESLKSIQRLIAEARVPFQKWIRYRDANRACISCDTTSSDIWDAGHLYKAELFSALIFDERNVNKQCRKCNGFMGGNENGYRVGLRLRYGIDYLHDLDAEANSKRNYKYTRYELKEIKEKYEQRLRELNL